MTRLSTDNIFFEDPSDQKYWGRATFEDAENFASVFASIFQQKYFEKLFSEFKAMADDLSNYKLQLQQVEVALLSDPQNTELLKLKDDIGRRFSLLWANKHKRFCIFLRSTRSASTGAHQDHRSQQIHRAIEFVGRFGQSCRLQGQKTESEDLEGRRQVYGARSNQWTVSF
jgi:hypothetical protein